MQVTFCVSETKALALSQYQHNQNDIRWMEKEQFNLKKDINTYNRSAEGVGDKPHC
jgi:hypothetical protein